MRCPWGGRNTCFSPGQKDNPPAEHIIVLEGAHRGIWLAWVSLRAGDASTCSQSWGDFTVTPELRWDSNAAKACRCCTLYTKGTGWDRSETWPLAPGKGHGGQNSFAWWRLLGGTWLGRPFSTGQQGVENICVVPTLPWAQLRVWKPRHIGKEQPPCSSPKCGEILPVHSGWVGKRRSGGDRRSCWFSLSLCQESPIQTLPLLSLGGISAVSSERVLWGWLSTGTGRGVPSSGVCKTWLDTAPSNLTLLWAGGWTRWSPEVPSNPDYPVSLWFWQSRYLHAQIKFQKVIEIILSNLEV